jgi:cysteinyl-tRNA synthetase
VARELNSAKAARQGDAVAVAAHTLRRMGAELGLLQQDPGAYLHRGVGEVISAADVEALLELRRQARSAKNFAESDRIRDQLASAGIALEDKAGGRTGWRRT